MSKRNPEHLVNKEIEKLESIGKSGKVNKLMLISEDQLELIK